MKSAAHDLITLRDVLRYAVSRFNAAGISFGHGTSNALDDAAFLILESLHLPIDALDPWLDARLTLDERVLLVERIETRIRTRKPTPYIVGRAYLQGLPFHVDERVIVPRSFIAELLVKAVEGMSDSRLQLVPEKIVSIADICTGSGCLAILASKLFPSAHVDAVDLSDSALEVARMNVAAHAAAVALHQGDLFAPLKGRRYDLVIANPPYVDEETMGLLPAEYQAEPVLALAGGFDGLDLVRRLLDEASHHINPGGGLLCEIGSGREILEMAYPGLPFLWLDTEESDGEVFWLPTAALPST